MRFMQARTRRAAATAAALWLAAAGAQATELVYRPVNPAFGGDPMNGSMLLNNAQSQNNLKDPATTQANAGLSQRTPLQQFSDTLQRSILSRLASSAAGGLFSSTGQVIPGAVETSEFRITVTDIGGGNLQITTVDKVTGQSTTFEVSQ